MKKIFLLLTALAMSVAGISQTITPTRASLSWNRGQFDVFLNLPSKCDTNFTTADRAQLRDGSFFFNHCDSSFYYFYANKWRFLTGKATQITDTSFTIGGDTIKITGQGGGGGGIPSIYNTATPGYKLVKGVDSVKTLGSATKIIIDTTTVPGKAIIRLDTANFDIRYTGRVKLYADGGQATFFLGGSVAEWTAGDSAVIETPSVKFAVHPDANFAKKVTVRGILNTFGTPQTMLDTTNRKILVRDVTTGDTYWSPWPAAAGGITPPSTQYNYYNGYGQFAFLSTDSVLEDPGHLYFHDANARAAITLTTTDTGAATYNNTTGVINIPTPGAGSTPTLPLVFAAGRTFTAGDSLNMGAFSMYIKGKLKADTFRMGVTDTVAAGGIYTAIGNSVTQGSGASIPSKSYASLVAARLQMAINNQGYGGYTLGNPPGTGAPSFLSVYTTAIPTKDAAHKLLSWCWGVNDAMYAAQYCCATLDYSTARFKAAYQTVIDYAIAHGTGSDVWNATNQFMISPVWQTTVNPVFQDSFYVASQQVAADNGMLFIDVYHATKNSAPGDKFDYVHPSDRGHAYLMQLIMRALDSAGMNYVKINPSRMQTVAINGVTEMDKAAFRNPDSTKDGATVATINPDGGLASAPMDRFMLFQNDLNHYLQSGNFWGSGTINAGGDIVSGGSGWFGGEVVPGTARKGALIGLFTGSVYIGGWDHGVALDVNIAPGGQTTGIGGLINSTRSSISAGSKNQFRGGTYMDEWNIIDSSGNRHAGRPLTWTTDGDTATYTDRHGIAHDIAFVDRLTSLGGVNHTAPIDSLAAVNDGLQIVSGHILAAQTATSTKPGMVTTNQIKAIAHDTAVAIRSQFESGTYVPTLTNTTNISTSSFLTATWTRVGNNVHVTVGGGITPTSANANAALTISLPFTTATTAQVGVGSGTLKENGGGRAQAGIQVDIVSGTTATASMWVTIATTGNYSFSIDYTL